VVWPLAKASLLGMSTISIFCIGMAAPAFVPRCAAARTRRICRPRPIPFSSEREDGDCRDPSGRAQARQRASGMGRIAENCRASFGNFGANVNYYYPPESGFLAANGKKLLDEVEKYLMASSTTSPVVQWMNLLKRRI
jgi:hypothetical protein